MMLPETKVLYAETRDVTPPLTRGTILGRAGNAEMTECEAQLSVLYEVKTPRIIAPRRLLI